MNKYISECIGTFALVFCGTGTIIVNEQYGANLGLFGIASAFGLIVCVMVYIFGNFLGAHINPSVTIALVVGKLISKKKALFYVISQLTGVFLASGMLKYIFSKNTTLGATIPSGDLLLSFVLEFILTFFLMLTILGVSSKKEYSSIAGLIIGLVVTGIILMAGPIS